MFDDVHVDNAYDATTSDKKRIITILMTFTTSFLLLPCNVRSILFSCVNLCLLIASNTLKITDIGEELHNCGTINVVMSIF